jgi:hypothetical protein
LQELRAGLFEVVPLRLLRVFNENELQLVIAGSETIDLVQWKQCTKYQGYSDESEQVRA